MDSEVDYLLSLKAIRDRAGIVFNAARLGDLTNFEFNQSRMSDAADYVTSIIKVRSLSSLS